MDTVERFWRKVEKSDGCWLWKGRSMTVGYGYFSTDSGRRHGYAHRFSWELHNGPIPAGLCVLHKCDVRLCVNPDHLFLGTRTDNSDDKTRKGRVPRGGDHWKSKLTEDQVLDIKDWIADGIQHHLIARHFGVCRQTVTSISTGRIWKHVGVPCPAR